MRKAAKASHKVKEIEESPIEPIENIEQENTGFKINKKILIILALAVFLGGIFYFKNNLLGPNTDKLKNQIIPDAVKKVINDPSVKIGINNIKDQSGVYEFELSLGDKGQKYTSYITKDGKILFTSGVKLEVLGQATQATPQAETKKLTCNDLSKSDSPNLTAYVVSDCPYGLQMQRLLKKTIDELPQIASQLTVRYIGSIVDGKITSMHGDKEAQENLKQICIREEQKEKYWDYVSCYMKEGKSEECSTTAGIDTTSLNACTGDQNRGLKYAKVDFDLANKLNVGSSPTLVLGDKQVISEFDFGGRIPNAIKEIIGCSFKTKPDVYKTDLTKEQVAASFSQSVAGSGTGGTAANCDTQ